MNVHLTESTWYSFLTESPVQVYHSCVTHALHRCFCCRQLLLLVVQKPLDYVHNIVGFLFHIVTQRVRHVVDQHLTFASLCS